MPRGEDRSDTALVLAELLDAALADRWELEQPVVAVLCQTGDDDDDLGLAVKHLEREVEEELAPFADDPGCLAVAHSGLRSSGRRITVGADHAGHVGLVRRPDGRVERVGDVDPLLVERLRSALPALNDAA